MVLTMVERLDLLIVPLEAMDSPDKIADYFQTLGVKGKPGSNARCAIANYVRDSLDLESKGCSVSVGSSASIFALDPNDWAKQRSIRIANRVWHSSVVRHFIYRFDAWQYPFLEEGYQTVERPEPLPEPIEQKEVKFGWPWDEIEKGIHDPTICWICKDLVAGVPKAVPTGIATYEGLPDLAVPSNLWSYAYGSPVPPITDLLKPTEEQIKSQVKKLLLTSPA